MTAPGDGDATVGQSIVKKDNGLPETGNESTTEGTVSYAQKQPPAESEEGIRTRTKIIASFWILIIVLGLPTWFTTTTIYRAKLPLHEMMAWADGKVSGRRRL